MSSTAEFVEDVEGRLQPLELELAEAWWQSNTESSQESDGRRIDAELARSVLLADADLFAADPRRGEATDPRADPLLRRRLDILYDAFVPQQVAADLRRGHRRARDRGGVDVQQLPRRDRRSPRRRQHDRRDPPHQRRRRRATRGVGRGEADRTPRSPSSSESSPGCATRRRATSVTATTSRSRCTPASSTKTGSSRRSADVDHATERPFTEWKHELDASLADPVRVRRRRAPARGISTTRSSRTRPPPAPSRSTTSSRTPTSRRSRCARTTASASTCGPCSTHSDLYARDGKSQHAFCIDIDREGDVRVLCNVEPSERWMETMLHEFGHAVYDRECRPDAALARPRRRALAHHRGHRDALRPAHPRSGVARRGGRRSTPTRSRRCARGSQAARAPGCSCSRAGCW